MQNACSEVEAGGTVEASNVDGPVEGVAVDLDVKVELDGGVEADVHGVGNVSLFTHGDGVGVGDEDLGGAGLEGALGVDSLASAGLDRLHTSVGVGNVVDGGGGGLNVNGSGLVGRDGLNNNGLDVGGPDVLAGVLNALGVEGGLVIELGSGFVAVHGVHGRRAAGLGDLVALGGEALNGFDVIVTTCGFIVGVEAEIEESSLGASVLADGLVRGGEDGSVSASFAD